MNKVLLTIILIGFYVIAVIVGFFIGKKSKSKKWSYSIKTS